MFQIKAFGCKNTLKTPVRGIYCLLEYLTMILLNQLQEKKISFTVATMSWLQNIFVTNDHRYDPLVVNTSWSFPHSWLITGFVTRVQRRVPLVEQELLILPGHLSSPPVFSGVRVTRSLVLCIMLCRSLFVLLYFFLLVIVLSVRLRFTDTDYSQGPGWLNELGRWI